MTLVSGLRAASYGMPVRRRRRGHAAHSEAHRDLAHRAQPRSLVEKLDLVTAAGNLAALVTPIAVFQRRNGRLALESWHPDSNPGMVVERTGFKFDMSGSGPTPAPTPRELAALGALDPDGEFEREAAIKPA